MNAPEFPHLRLRRLRRTPALRALIAETRLSVQQLVLPLFARPGRKTRLSVQQLVLPLFARPGRKTRLPVRAMPGVAQLSPDECLK